MIQDKHLIAEINALPPDEQAKVVDFIQRLKARRNIKDHQDPSPVATENSSLPAPQNEPGQKRLTFGCMKGTVTYMADDFNDPLEDFAEYM